MKNFIQKFFNFLGYEISRIDTLYKNNFEFKALLNEVSEYTMTSNLRIFALYQSIKYIINNKIEGDIVECGVWKGGSMMLVAKMLKKVNLIKTLYLYDTFEGMTNPGEFDYASNLKKNKNNHASMLIKRDSNLLCLSSLDEVMNNLFSTNYEKSRINFIKGDVKDTLQRDTPSNISLLRLDTDWYESTLIELNTLYPKLNKGGIIIIDDYESWEGCKKAVDEYFKFHKDIYFHRIDDHAILGVKLHK